MYQKLTKLEPLLAPRITSVHLQNRQAPNLPAPQKISFPNNLKIKRSQPQPRIAGPERAPVIESLFKDDELNEPETPETRKSPPPDTSPAFQSLLDIHDKNKRNQSMKISELRDEGNQERANIRRRNLDKKVNIRDVSSRHFPSIMYTRKDGYEALKGDGARRSLFIRKSRILIPLPSRLAHDSNDNLTPKLASTYRLRTTWEDSPHEMPLYFRGYYTDGLI
jgi:hypothetical protein